MTDKGRARERAEVIVRHSLSRPMTSLEWEDVIAQALLDFRKEVLGPLKKLPLLADAHWINIVIRRNGKDEVYQADWLKELVDE